MSRLVLPAEHAALVGQRKPCECAETAAVKWQYEDCEDDCTANQPLVPWWPSPDPLPHGPVEIVAHHADCNYHSVADPRCSNINPGGILRLRPGDVVATAVVTAVIPVVSGADPCAGPHIHLPCEGMSVAFIGSAGNWRTVDLSYLSDLGIVYSPGQHAVALAEVEPT